MGIASIEDIRRRRDARRAESEATASALEQLTPPAWLAGRTGDNSAFFATNDPSTGGEEDPVGPHAPLGRTALVAASALEGKESAAAVEADAAGRVLAQIAEGGSSTPLTEAINAFNDRHFITFDGKSTTIVEEAFDPELNVPTFRYHTIEGCRALHAHKLVPAGDRMINLVTAWVSSPHARRYIRGMAMLPGEQAPEGVYNLYRGWGVEPQAGDAKLVMEFLFDVICSRDQTSFDYLLGWLAWGAQHPGRQGEVAVVLRGGRGTGKGFLGRLMCQIYGAHGFQVFQQRHVVGNFNAHLRHVLFLFADEAFFAGDRQAGDVLKGLITEDRIAIERKGVDTFAVRNRIKLLMATNHEWVIPAGADERRFFVLDVSDDHKQDHAYFGQLDRHLKHGGAAAFLQTLLAYDLTGFNLRKAPSTAALVEQKLLSLGLFEQWVYANLCEGRLKRGPGGWSVVPCAEVIEDFRAFVAERGALRYTNTEPRSVGKRLKKLIPSLDRCRGGGRWQRAWAYRPASLALARHEFERHALGGDVLDWPEVDDEDSTAPAHDPADPAPVGHWTH